MFAHNVKMTRASGFTLLEVLIAFIILAVGLLAIVSLQGTSKQYTHQAMQRSLAVSHAESIIERIRANPTALQTYIGSGTIGGGTIVDEPDPDCVDEFCTNIELATHDIWVFEQKLDGTASTITEGGVTSNTSGLIEPRACMAFTPRGTLVNTGFLTIRIQWTGLQEISDAVTVDGTNCGGAAAGADDFRRQVVVNTYVIDEREL